MMEHKSIIMALETKKVTHIRGGRAHTRPRPHSCRLENAYAAPINIDQVAIVVAASMAAGDLRRTESRRPRTSGRMMQLGIVGEFQVARPRRRWAPARSGVMTAACCPRRRPRRRWEALAVVAIETPGLPILPPRRTILITPPPPPAPSGGTPRLLSKCRRA